MCVSIAGMQLQDERAAVLSDRDKGIACACRDLRINERKCAVHIHANFYLAGFFLGPKKDSRGPFVEFVKAHNQDQSDYLLLQLREHHVADDKWTAFLSAYQAVEPWVSVLSAMNKGLDTLPSCLSLASHQLACVPIYLFCLSAVFPCTFIPASFRRVAHFKEGHKQQR